MLKVTEIAFSCYPVEEINLKAKGVKFRMEPFPTPVCRMALIYDTEVT